MRSTPATTKNAFRKLLLIFILIALALIFGDYLLRTSNKGNSIENNSHTPVQRQPAH